jgi:hypothetical protein
MNEEMEIEVELNMENWLSQIKKHVFAFSERIQRV